MKHATSAALDRLEPVLAAVREIPGLKERTRGVFYRKSAAYLHFHEDRDGLFADLRRTHGDFDRYRVETPEEQTAFLVVAKGG